MVGPSVFISSTYSDLASIRDTVANFLRSIKYIPISFESGAIGFQTAKNLDEDCYEAVKHSDYFILIVGKRYGSASSDGNKSGRYSSITKVEFETAIEEKIPVFVFVQESVLSDYQIFQNNNKNTKIQYPNVDDVNVLYFVKDIYRKIGATHFIYKFNSANDINDILKKQFATIVKESAKTRRALNTASDKVRINSIKLWYQVTKIHKYNFAQVSKLVDIPKNKFERLLRIQDRNNPSLDEDIFPFCAYSTLKKLEKALACEGQLSVGQSDDFHNMYLSLYFDHYHKRFFKNLGDRLSNNGFEVKAVVFDFDGTLTAPMNGLTSWEEIWKHLGYTNEECAYYHGEFRRKNITHEEWCDITTEHFNAKSFSRKKLSHISNKILLHDNTTMVLKRLYEEGFQLYVLSGSIEEIIKTVLKDSSQYFRHISANQMQFDASGKLMRIISTPYDFEHKAEYIKHHVINNNKLHPLETLYIGNSSNDAWVSQTGARTLCINPHLTDPDTPEHWSNKIPVLHNFEDILPFVYRGSRNSVYLHNTDDFLRINK